MLSSPGVLPPLRQPLVRCCPPFVYSCVVPGVEIGAGGGGGELKCAAMCECGCGDADVNATCSFGGGRDKKTDCDVG